MAINRFIGIPPCKNLFGGICRQQINANQSCLEIKSACLWSKSLARVLKTNWCNMWGGDNRVESRNGPETAVISTTLHFLFSFRNKHCPVVTTHVMPSVCRGETVCVDVSVCMSVYVCGSVCWRGREGGTHRDIAGKLKCPLCRNSPDGTGQKPGLWHTHTHAHTQYIIWAYLRMRIKASY